MSGYTNPVPNPSPGNEDDFDFGQAFQTLTNQVQQEYQGHGRQTSSSNTPQQRYYPNAQALYHGAPPFQEPFGMFSTQPSSWATPIVPSNHQQDQYAMPFPQYAESIGYNQPPFLAGPSRMSAGYLSPDEAGQTRSSRAQSFASNASSAPSVSQSDVSRSTSPNACEMVKWGRKNDDGSWSCAYPGCSSRSKFNRGCDLRKHYKRHTKTLFCRHEGCPQATEGGFSSKKDRLRHEAKHNPNIVCEWDGCGRLFSRVDNMKDHVRRVHRRRVES